MKKLPPQEKILRTVLFGVVWIIHTAAGCILAMMLHLQNLNFDIDSQFSNLTIQQVLRWNIYYCCLPILTRFARKNSPLQQSFSLMRFHTKHIIGCSVYGIVTFLATRFVVNTALGNPPWLWNVQHWETIGQAFIKFYVIPPQGLAISILHYCCVMGCVWGIDYYRKTQQERLRAMDLERQLTAAQLDTLKMQLHPHFLFNTLNSAVSLVHDNPDAAETMLVRLSAFLRKTLDSSSLQTVSLQEELEFLRLYTGIEVVRFGDRLRIREDIDPQTLGSEVPSLLLQPIVENAIRHGVADRRSGGTITIKTRIEVLPDELSDTKSPPRLVIQIQDDGGGLASEPTVGLGIGLANTRTRLQKLYGKHQSFIIGNITEGGVCVTMTLPFTPFVSHILPITPSKTM